MKTRPKRPGGADVTALRDFSPHFQAKIITELIRDMQTAARHSGDTAHRRFARAIADRAMADPYWVPSQRKVERMHLLTRAKGGRAMTEMPISTLAAIPYRAGRDRSIADAYDAFVPVVHYSGKDASCGSRGHSTLPGAIDPELQMVDGVLTVTKQHDGQDGLRFGTGPKLVEIGNTPKGKRVYPVHARERVSFFQTS